MSFRNFKVESLLIPENYIRMSMKTIEFDEYLLSNCDSDALIYILNGIRYLFMEGDIVIEEYKEK